MNRKKLTGATLAGVLVALVAAVPLWQGARAGQAATYATLKDDGEIRKGAIANAVEPLFDAEAVGITQALIVMRYGRVIAERYGAGIGPDTKLLSRSIG
ncbi:MAG: serine hydrolase, partial [Sphingobium sp.]